ncbi:MAG: AraC family transcriptional regulator [Candidatus Firestonebacteria bacterium]
MKENLTEKISLKMMAEHIHLSPSRFSHIFKMTTGYSPQRYFLKLKMDEAQKLLLYSHKTITQITGELGFTSIHHFSRIFKEFNNQSPLKYRLYNLARKDKRIAILSKDKI